MHGHQFGHTRRVECWLSACGGAAGDECAPCQGRWRLSGRNCTYRSPRVCRLFSWYQNVWACGHCQTPTAARPAAGAAAPAGPSPPPPGATSECRWIPFNTCKHVHIQPSPRSCAWAHDSAGGCWQAMAYAFTALQAPRSLLRHARPLQTARSGHWAGRWGSRRLAAASQSQPPPPPHEAPVPPLFGAPSLGAWASSAAEDVARVWSLLRTALDPAYHVRQCSMSRPAGLGCACSVPHLGGTTGLLQTPRSCLRLPPACACTAIAGIRFGGFRRRMGSGQ